MTHTTAPCRLRLVADFVIPAADHDILTGAAIEIDLDSGTIVGVGPEHTLGDHPGARVEIGGVLLPGLVNAHAHSPMTLLRSAGDGTPLAAWLSDYIVPIEARLTAADVRTAMLLGAAEMHLNGVTTSCEMFVHEDVVVEACIAAGHRAVVAPAVFSSALDDGDPTGRLDQIAALRRATDDPLVTVGYGPHSLYDLAPCAVAEIARHAAEANVTMTIHLDETTADRDVVFERHRDYGTGLLEAMGAVNELLVCAHGTWLSHDDDAKLTAGGASVAHCPSSNLKLGSGIAPLTRLLASGVNVALGTDGPASNDRLDLWEEMRLAALLARGSTLDATALSPERALALATTNGAKALGLAAVGALRPGAEADIIRVGLDSPAFATSTEHNLLAQLVFAGSAAHVTDVWCGGRRVVDGGVHTLVDVERVAHHAAAAARRIGNG